jgi:hypothetical protein
MLSDSLLLLKHFAQDGHISHNRIFGLKAFALWEICEREWWSRVWVRVNVYFRRVVLTFTR